MDILCIGHAAYDVTLPLEKYPQENDKYSIEESLEAGGGPAANAAYLLAKWGVKTGFVGLIGEDIYGERIIREFQEVDVDLSLIEIEKNYPTPFSTILINKENGSRTIINRKLPHRGLKINKQLLENIQPKVILVDGHELEASLEILERFPKAISLLDAGSLKEATEILARKVDYLVASEKFAKQYSTIEDLDSAENYKKCMDRLKKLSPQQVVVTLGDQGLIYDKQGEIIKLPAYNAKAIDTTGAGDIFHGAFAYGLLRDFSLMKNLKFSSATSALSVEKLGGRQSIPDLEEVEEKCSGISRKNTIE